MNDDSDGSGSRSKINFKIADAKQIPEEHDAVKTDGYVV